jgi:hypothetical protein
MRIFLLTSIKGRLILDVCFSAFIARDGWLPGIRIFSKLDYGVIVFTVNLSFNMLFSLGFFFGSCFFGLFSFCRLLFLVILHRCFFFRFGFRFLPFSIFILCFRGFLFGLGSHIIKIRLAGFWSVKCGTFPLIAWHKLEALDAQVMRTVKTNSLMASKEEGVVLEVFSFAKITANTRSPVRGFVGNDHWVMVLAKHRLIVDNTLFIFRELSVVAFYVTVYLFMWIIQIHGFSFLQKMITHYAVSTKVKVAFWALPAIHASCLIKVGDASKAALEYCAPIAGPACEISLLSLYQLMLMLADL